MGAINDYGIGVLTLLKSGTNTWVLDASSSYSGATSINDGILRFTADQTLAGALNFGSANSITTAGELDLSPTAPPLAETCWCRPTLRRRPVSSSSAPGSLSRSMARSPSAAGRPPPRPFRGHRRWCLQCRQHHRHGRDLPRGQLQHQHRHGDFSALASMNVSLNTAAGILQVGSTSGTNSTGYGALILAQSTTITASALTVGGGGSYNGNAGQVNVLQLGSSANVINVGAVNVGTGSRDLAASPSSAPPAPSPSVPRMAWVRPPSTWAPAPAPRRPCCLLAIGTPLTSAGTLRTCFSAP